MAETNTRFPELGGVAGFLTLGASTALFAISTLLAVRAEGMIPKVDDNNFVDPSSTKPITLSLWFVCIATMANVFAMVIEHTYIIIRVGIQRLFTRPYPSSIRWNAVVLECILWVCFLVEESIFLTETIIFWQYSQTNESRLRYRTGMISRAGYISCFACYIIVFLHKLVVEVQASIPEENRVRTVLAAIRQFPISVVEQVDEDYDCAVCLDTPTIGETIRKLPCHHIFHRDCIDTWLVRRSVCPLCKLPVC